MIHLNKTKEGRWTSMTFIPQSHNIYCLSFHLKHEGMDYIVDNSKISRNIGVTDLIMERIINIPICTKKSSSKCKDRLWLTCEDLQSPTPWIASQVQNSWASLRKKIYEYMYDGGIPYISPPEEWINKACQIDASPWHKF